MKKSLLALVLFCVAVFVTTASAQIANITHPANSPYGSIQAAINDAITVTSDVITVGAGTHNGAVTVNKGITIQGVGPSTVITNASGIGITVTVPGVAIADLKVLGCSGSGIFASGVANLTLTNVESDGNGTGTAGSGIDVKGITGTSIFTNLTANSNKRHGLSIGNGSTGVSVSGGTFTGNGFNGDPNTGGGIIVYADAGTTTSGVSISGTVNSNTNKTAGIYLFSEPTGHVNSTTIGATGTVTLNDNGSGGGSYGTGGAAVLVYGGCNGTTITATSANSGAVNPTAGLVVLGTDATGSNSPTNTVAINCTLSGFNLTSPAGTMYAHSGVNTLICTSNVDATVGNDIVGFTAGFQVEDALYHKMDDSQLGLFRGPGTVLFVTPNSGSINRAIGIANNPYSVTEIDVKDGTYVENVVVNKALIISGQGANTIIHPSSGNGVDVTIAGVTLENLHIYLSTTFNGTFAPTATTNTFTFRAQAKVFLQGPFSAGSMSTALNSVLPLSQPYNVAPFSYAGTETVVSVPATAVDWVLVELRSGTAAATMTAQRAAFLQNDGTLLEIDGTTGVWETVGVASGYDLTSSIVIRHRNHLAVMSASSEAMPNASAFDFTTAATQAYGVSAEATLTGGVGGMFAGDGNQDGQILGSDFSVWLVQAKLSTSGYTVTDYNMDGQVLGSDFAIWLVNAKLSASTQVPL